ncbi:hypothetical protein OPT61_g2980 [Boeremia exigua]|uniref:Uncharacterized protein n=1 Tax=Boeremia exigua TaxID=749465 RepID=A0ACC2IJH5_9PLEO|nr:hypothetical protein OPT61_g2980 [Boeremia exigua]
MADRRSTEQASYRLFDKYLTVERKPPWHRNDGHEAPLPRKYHSDGENRHESRRVRRPSDSGLARTKSHSGQPRVLNVVHNHRNLGSSARDPSAFTQLSYATQAQVPDPPKNSLGMAPSPRALDAFSAKARNTPPPVVFPRVSKRDTVQRISHTNDNTRSGPPNSAQVPAGRPRSRSRTELRTHSMPSIITTGPETLFPLRRASATAQTQPKVTFPSQSDSDVARSRRRGSDASTLVAASLGSGTSSHMRSTYQYVRLKQGEFRLVRIFRKTLDIVRCEIVSESLDRPPKYTAISYAWGDPDDRCDIELYYNGVCQGINRNDTAIPARVTVNLRGALKALRREDEDVLVWIDGLSIDQDNNEERAEQVRQMSTIYGRANSVAIWLGPEQNNSNTALRILKKIAETDRTGGDFSSLIASYAGNAEFASLVSLFEREYWKRLWVVQEVFIPASDRIHVYCGERSNTWATYKTASNLLEQCRDTIDRIFPGNKDNGPRHHISGQQYSFAQVLSMQGPASLPNRDLQNLGSHPLLEIMRSCREKFTANPLDKVYGILGLLPEHVRKDFPVNYQSSVKALYVRVFNHVLLTKKSLGIMCEAVHFPLYTSNASLPTWCPDWYHMPATKALRNVDKFAASKNRQACFKFPENRPLRLEIEAIYLGRVREHGVAVGTLTTSVDHLTAFLSWRALLLDKIKSKDVIEQGKLIQIFCRTLCLGQVPSFDKAFDWKTVCYRVFGALLAANLPQLLLDEELARHAKLEGVVAFKHCRQFLGNFSQHMMGRRFCLLDDGRLMGLGSGLIGIGDVVVVPFGCSTPIVLRKEGAEGEFRYVGDVYVDQYMHGKAVEDYDSGRAKKVGYVLH